MEMCLVFLILQLHSSNHLYESDAAMEYKQGKEKTSAFLP